jgi:DDE superfamily endonuclease
LYLISIQQMRRASGDDNPDTPPAKKQKTLGEFFRRADGQPLSEPKVFHLPCPYCDFRATSEISVASLPGALRTHVQWRHPDDFFEASVRLHAAFSSIRRTLFDLIGMDPIPEEEEEKEDGPAGERPVAEQQQALPALAPSKPKHLHHSYSLKTKFKTLEALDKAEAVIKASLSADSVFFAISLLQQVNHETGIPVSTLKDWVTQKNVIRTRYSGRKRDRKSRRVGSGRKALFPKAEVALALLVRERRQQCKLVSKEFVLRHLKLEAQKEDAAKYEKAKFSSEMVSGFMRRNRFSLRYPSCIRSDDLASAILICRAYHRQLLSVLADDGDIHYSKKPLDPSFGRFALKYRFNGDEVPYRFGRVKSIVSLTNESLTHVSWPPGWEARLATLFLVADARGHVVIVVVIFKGSFENLSKKLVAEVNSYRTKYPGVRVYFQNKAWMDGAVLSAITKEVFNPYLRDLWAADGVDFAESLLVLDNGPGRTEPKFLQALGRGNTFLLKLPPNQTGYVQMIDDNVGRVFRDLACDVLEEDIEAMAPEELKALSTERKRAIMVKAAHQAFLTWKNSERHQAIGMRAALRTGLAMRIDDSCAGVRPTRFPEGYELTIPSASNAPVRSYFDQTPAPPAAVVLNIPEDLHAGVEVAGLSAATATQITIGAPGTALAIRVEPATPRPQRIQEEVAVFDGWSDEEERVFLEEEASASESSSDDEESDPYARRSARRRRWCLTGCDCERPLGTRKCSCERAGDNYCSEQCLCDPALCRSRLVAEAAEPDD